MSILIDLLSGKNSFATASRRFEQWAAAIVKSDPAAVALTGQLLSDVKQGASDFVTIADTQLGQLLLPAAHAVEVGLDAFLASATKGASMPFNPIMDSVIDNAAKHLKQAADAWALKAKASLADPASTASPPSTASAASASGQSS